jgi:hypothetical protein
MARRSIWTRAKHRIGLERLTFAHDSVAKVSRGSLQPNKKLLPVRAARISAKQAKKVRNYLPQLRLQHLLQLVMRISLGKTRK